MYLTGRGAERENVVVAGEQKLCWNTTPLSLVLLLTLGCGVWCEGCMVWGVYGVRGVGVRDVRCEGCMV